MSSMTNQELRQRLIALGFNAPPVTDTSRKLLVKKLEKLEASIPPANTNNPPANTSNPPANTSNPPANTSNPPANTFNNINNFEAKTRKTRSAKPQDSPERMNRSFTVDKSPLRQTRSKTEENNYDKVDSTSSVKKIKTSTPYTDTFPKRDPFERGSDSDDSVLQSGRPLARKPLGVRRESQYFSSRTPTMYRSFDTDNGAASYLNQDIYRPKSTSNLPWHQKLNRKVSGALNKITPAWIPLGFGLFFIVVAGIYFSKNDRQYGDLLLDDVKFLQCKDRSASHEPCIPDGEVDASLKCLKMLYRELWRIEADQVCGARATVPSKRYLTTDNFTELVISEIGILRFEADKIVSNVKTLTKQNYQIGVVFDKIHGFKLENVELPWKCSFTSFLFKLYDYVSYVVLTLLLILSIHLLFRWVQSRLLKNAKDRADILKGITEVLQQTAITNPSQPYLPIVHVRDQLIPYKDREKKKKMWAEAVKYIEEHESRVRIEVQPYQGEDYEVWRWIGGHQISLPKPKTWHGEAFETSKDTMNTPSTSPTPCLKIRNMFDPKNETDNEDWVTRVKDAILERCEGVNVIHIVVDETNSEGCVYIKCASTDDAGKAYRKMHGAWFDGKIVSVKYLRLERYHERYPSSIGLTKHLVPSNDQKKSII